MGRESDIHSLWEVLGTYRVNPDLPVSWSLRSDWQVRRAVCGSPSPSGPPQSLMLPGFFRVWALFPPGRKALESRDPAPTSPGTERALDYELLGKWMQK